MKNLFVFGVLLFQISGLALAQQEQVQCQVQQRNGYQYNLTSRLADEYNAVSGSIKFESTSSRGAGNLALRDTFGRVFTRGIRCEDGYSRYIVRGWVTFETHNGESCRVHFRQRPKLGIRLKGLECEETN